jgi:hypothetical protein
MTTEMEQVDDATYPVRSKEWWRASRPYDGPCAWGVASKPTELLLRARAGKLVTERNACDRVIAEAMAH